jgi:Family of unknown function (DUF5681)
MSVESGHKFQPGRSGNPAGRPRGSKSKSTQLVERLVAGNVQDVKEIEKSLLRQRLVGYFLRPSRSGRLNMKMFVLGACVGFIAATVFWFAVFWVLFLM